MRLAGMDALAQGEERRFLLGHWDLGGGPIISEKKVYPQITQISQIQNANENLCESVKSVDPIFP